MRTENLIQFGIVNIDKLAGPTSHQVAEYVRKILHIKKSGHSGTLDPGVTGCLPVALGKATRILELMLKYGKEYVCVMELHKDLDEKELREAIMTFKGEIEQLPPVKSAVKRQLRKRTIYDIEILEIEKRLVLFRVECEAGTYIRKLVHDIGEKLKVGAQMKELRRTRAGVYDESTLVSLNDLRDAYELWKQGNPLGEELLRKYIQPIESATERLAKAYINEIGKNRILHGQNLYAKHLKSFEDGNKNDTVAIMEESIEEITEHIREGKSKNDKLIALGKYVKDTKEKIKEKEIIKESEDSEKLMIKVFKVFQRPD